MYEWTRIQRWRFAAIRCAGLGAIAGGVEAVSQALSLRLPLSSGEFAGLAVVTVLVMAAFGVVVGLVTGVSQLLLGGRAAPQAVSIHLGLAATALCLVYLGPAAAGLLAEDRQFAALLMVTTPLSLFFVVYFNAHYFLRRYDLGVEYRIGFLPAAFAFAGLLAIGAVGTSTFRYTGGAGALAGDPNVVIVSVPGLRRDHVRTTWGGSPAATDAVDAVANGGGVTFADAVTPTPVTRGSHATVLTGLHPLRHRVIAEEQPLQRGFRTLAEVLDREGYATGGFVATAAASGDSGLSQGFRTYDEGGLWRHVFVLGRLLPAAPVRDADVVVDGFEAWLSAHAALPLFAWIELGDVARWEHEDGVSRTGYAAEVEAVDAAYGRIRELLAEHGVADRTLVLFHGAHGQMLGEHDVLAKREGLWEELVRVPLVIEAPGQSLTTDRVEAQVRLMDIAPTALGYLGIDGFEQTEGVNLLEYATGRRSKAMWCALVGEDDGESILGMRANGVKYVRRPSDDARQLYELGSDPEELHDLSESNDTTVADAERLLAADFAALRKLAR
ncbi:MAG: hypothetical protein EP330_08970 [Deltaproteobacteria bacterium]|nr:MAG: hypothetical protein EP330_08970 [Deltaproteobacteria bacterium]